MPYHTLKDRGSWKRANQSSLIISSDQEVLCMSEKMIEAATQVSFSKHYSGWRHSQRSEVNMGNHFNRRIKAAKVVPENRNPAGNLLIRLESRIALFVELSAQLIRWITLLLHFGVSGRCTASSWCFWKWMVGGCTTNRISTSRRNNWQVRCGVVVPRRLNRSKRRRHTVIFEKRRCGQLEDDLDAGITGSFEWAQVAERA